METTTPTQNSMAQDHQSRRIAQLRQSYFNQAALGWSPFFFAFGTGIPWDEVFDITNYYAAGEACQYLSVFSESLFHGAKKIPLPKEFYKKSIGERRAWFIQTILADHAPMQLLPGDLIAGDYFALAASLCLTKKEAVRREKLLEGKNGLGLKAAAFYESGYGCCGVTTGGLVPDYQSVLQLGFSGLSAQIRIHYDLLDKQGKHSPKGAQLRAMLLSCKTPVLLAKRYAAFVAQLRQKETDPLRAKELETMEELLHRVPDAPAQTFQEALQSLWLAHLTAFCEVGFPGAAIALGRIDQYLLPYWQYSIQNGMARSFGKELIKCFLLHISAIRSAMPRLDGQAVWPDGGQPFTLSGSIADGTDGTNELTYVILEVIDELGPLDGISPCVRIHENVSNRLLGHLLKIASNHPTAPFLLSFDRRNAAGFTEEAYQNLWPNSLTTEDLQNHVCLGDFGCFPSQSGCVAVGDCRINMVKPVELALGGGLALNADPAGKPRAAEPGFPKTGNPRGFSTFEEFYTAFVTQLSHLTKCAAQLYAQSLIARGEHLPTPYVSCLIDGCAEEGQDATHGGGRYSLATMSAIGFATAVDALLAVRYLVFEHKVCTMDILISCLQADWTGCDILQAIAKYRAPKFGRDDDLADDLAAKVIRDWQEIVWQLEPLPDQSRFQPGLYPAYANDKPDLLQPATPDGRTCSDPLRNGVSPASNFDDDSPSASANSAGKALGGSDTDGNPICLLSGGALHTITLPRSMVITPEHRAKLCDFLRGYGQNGGAGLKLHVVCPPPAEK